MTEQNGAKKETPGIEELPGYAVTAFIQVTHHNFGRNRFLFEQKNILWTKDTPTETEIGRVIGEAIAGIVAGGGLNIDIILDKVIAYGRCFRVRGANPLDFPDPPE